MARDTKIGETYLQREDEEILKWANKAPEQQAEGPKPQKPEPKKKEEGGGLIGAVRDFGMALHSLPEKAADVLYPKQAREPEKIAPGATDLTPGQTIKQGVSELGEVVGKRMGEGVEQLKTAFAGKSKPLEFGGKKEVFGQEPETPEQVKAAQPSFSSDKLGFMRDLLSGSFGVAVPFGAAAGHALGEAYDWKNLYSGAMTDEVLKARLAYNREKYGEDAFETQLTKDLLNKPYEQRLADGRAMAEMVGEAISGFIPGYTGLAAVVSGGAKAGVKATVKAGEQAGRAAVGQAAEEGARVAAGQAEWAKRMTPPAEKPKMLGPGAYEMPPSSLPGEQGARAVAETPAPAAEPAVSTAKAAGEAPEARPRDIQDWADETVASIKGPGDIEGQLRASVEATKKAKGAAEAPMPGPGAERRRAMGNQVGAIDPGVAFAASRMAVGAVVGGMVGEDPYSAGAGALAGLALSPRAAKAMKAAMRRGENAFTAGQDAVRLERAADEMIERGAKGGFTYSPTQKAFPDYQEGFAVSIAPERTTTIRGRAATQEDALKFIERNQKYLQDERVHVGGWKDSEGFHFDLSIVTPSREEALALGTKYKQKAIFDFKNKSDIRVAKHPHGEMGGAAKLTDEEKAFADEYDKAIHDPNAKPAWDALIADTERLFDDLTGGEMPKLKVETVEGKQPYASLAEMQADLDKGVLKVSDIGIEHPFWSREQNLKFRAVHDYLGHKHGADFSLQGEYKAFQAQAEHLTSAEAKRALQTEVYGQAASYYKNQAFGEQKAFLPKEDLNLKPFDERLGEISGGAPVAQVTPKGYQPGYQDVPGFELFNLEHDIPGHPKGSTVTAASIEEAGYRMPPELENALAPRGAADTAEAAMGGTKGMTESEGKAALAQVRANEKILAELRAMRDAGRYEPTWLETIWDIFRNQEGRIGAKLPNTKEALEFMQKELPNTDWYAGIREELQKHFADDWKLVADIIAVTSPNTRVAENVDMALKAYAAYKRGEPIEKLASEVASFGDVKLKVQGLLEGKSLEEVLKSRDKVWHFAAALKGDLNAVVIDRWMWKLFYPDEVALAEAAGKGYKGTSARYKLLADWITKEADKLGLAPAELQAGLWCAKKIADGDPAGIKPLREFIGDWMKENKNLNEGLDFFQNIGKELPGMNQAGKIDLGTAMLLGRMAIGAAVGSTLGDDPSSMAMYALMGSGLGSVASMKTVRRLQAGLKPEARASLDNLTDMLKQRGEMGLPPISGGSDAFIPKQIFQEFAKKSVPAKDLKAAHLDLNQKLDYARRLGEGMWKGDDLLVDAVKQSRFKSVEDVFKLDPASVAAIDVPGVVKDMKAMNAFVLEDLMQATARAKLLGTPEAAADVAKRYAYAGRYSQRVSDVEKSLGRQAMHPERMQAVVDFDTLTKEVAEYEAKIGAQISNDSVLVQMISRTADRAAVQQLAEQGSRWPQALWNIYYGLNLLSSPLTHVKNIIGNITGLGMYVADRAAGEFLVHPIFKLLGKGEEGIQLGETAQIVRGIWEMVGDSFRAQKKGAWQYGAEAFWSGESRFGKDTKAGERIRMMAAKDTQGVEGPVWVAKVIDTMSSLAQYNMRFMDGTDEFFKMLSFNGELRALAKREAKQQMGKAGAKSMEELLQSPTTTMLQGAQAFAHENTFTKAFSANAKDWQHLKGLGYQLQQVSGNPYARVLATPFFRTPTRVAEFSTVHTPVLNLLAVQTASDLAAGGAKAELAYAKMATGMAITGFTFYLATQGVITGDWPKDPSLAARYRENGWQPRSIYNPVLNKYHSYAGMGPLEHMLSGAANFAVAWPHLKDHELETMFWATTLTYGNSLTDNPFLQGASDIGDIVTAVHRGESVDGMLAYAQQRMLTAMPGAALGRQVQKALGQGSDVTEYRTVSEGPKNAEGKEDVGQRELHTLWGRTMQQVPGYGTLYGEGLPAKINYVDGKAIPSESGFLGMVFPWQVTTNKNDHVLNELQRLNGARFPKEMPYTLGGPMKNDSVIQKDTLGPEGVKLLTKERAEFAKLISTLEDENGDTFYQALEREIDTDDYKDASDINGKFSAQAARLHTIYQKFFDMARDEFLTAHPEIKNLLEQRGLERDLDKLPKSRQDERAQRIQDLQDQQDAR